jgi:hypothetical protein
MWTLGAESSSFKPSLHCGLPQGLTIEGLVGEIACESRELIGLIGVEHQLEELVVAGEQRDAAAKIRLMPDTRPRGEAFGRLGRTPAQHLPDAEAAPDLGEAIKHSARVRSGEVSEADVAGGDA